MKARTWISVAACVAALGAGAPIAAQDFNLAPTFGEVTLETGFPDDPFIVEVLAGGANPAAALGPDCAGFIADAPDYRLHLTAGDVLFISVVSDEDTTLVVNDPSGGWHCDDDSYELNPAIVFEAPLDGQYDIWIGAFSGGEPAATLYISEIGTGPEYLAFLAANAPTDPPNVDAEPALGIFEIAAGFTPDPLVIDAVSGGPLNAAGTGTGCVGFIAEVADVGIQYTAGEIPLYFGVTSDGDTTLVIRDPEGNWHCDDDSGGNLNPYLGIQNPVSGLYLVWIGSYESGAMDDAQLIVTEVPR